MSKRPDQNTTLRTEADARHTRVQLPEAPAQPAKVMMHELQAYQIEITSNANINAWSAYVSIQIPDPD